MDIAEMVKAAGVVGAGGAGFPSHIKLAAKADTVLANGAECEPLLYSDQYVMQEHAGEVVDGLRAAMRATGAGRGILCIKGKYAQVIEGFEKLTASSGDISILKLGNFYPSGDEHILVYEATGRIVPEGGIPLNVGVVVQNVGTLMQVARALKKEPVTHRVITVGGEVVTPGVYIVPVGISVADVLARCGGAAIENGAVMLNGPMMGRLAGTGRETITKTTGGVFVLPQDHPHVMRMKRPLGADIRLSRGACEQCRYCTDLCPRFLQGHALEPHKVMRVINEQREPEAETVMNAWLCCECGVCDLFACPIALSPRRFFRDFKSKLAQRGMRFAPRGRELKTDIRREYRRVPKDKLTRRLALGKYDHKPEIFGGRMEAEAVEIPLSAHIGAPALPLVKAGDRVKAGQAIGAIPEGKMGAAAHASIDGTVTKVNGFVRIER